MTSSLESWIEVQLEDGEIAAVDEDLHQRLTEAYLRTSEFADLVAEFITDQGEYGRLHLLSEMNTTVYDLLTSSIEQLEQHLEEIRS